MLNNLLNDMETLLSTNNTMVDDEIVKFNLQSLEQELQIETEDLNVSFVS